MLDKLKTNLLWIVALLLGYSGWSRAQDPDEASACSRSRTLCRWSPRMRCKFASQARA